MAFCSKWEANSGRDRRAEDEKEDVKQE